MSPNAASFKPLLILQDNVSCSDMAMVSEERMGGKGHHVMMT